MLDLSTGYSQALWMLVASSWLFSLASLALALRRVSLHPLKRRIADLELQVRVLEEQGNQLLGSWKRVNARIAMAQARDKRHVTPDGLPDPQENPEAWRAAVRKRAESATRRL